MRLPPEFSLKHLPARVTASKQIVVNAAPASLGISAVLPGSFNPFHAGHRQLALVAESLLGHPLCYELSVVNVDKPDVTTDYLRQRLDTFAEERDLWITRAPRFTQKAELFPGATFVVGADTALRLVQTRYYGESESKLHEALESIRRLDCRFLVGARVDASGKLLTVADLPIPREHRELFGAIPSDMFRCNVSSTSLRVSPANEP